MVFLGIISEDNIIMQLKEYDRLYYTDGTSPVDDGHYDELKNKAKELYPGNLYFSEVGAPVIGDKVNLPFVLGSLNKVKPDDIQAWLDKQPGDIFLITEKLDGVSFMVTYDNYKVVFAATRGDGNTGRDITDKAKIFCKPPKTRDRISYRAEAMLMGDTYKELDFKTARNGVAGILNRDYLKGEENIVSMFYEILDDVDLANEIDRYNFMLENFSLLNTPNSIIFNKKEHPISVLVTFLEMSKNNGRYEVDGLVITPMDYEREDVMFPDNKVAFKMNEKPVEVEVTKVEWKVSRTGRVVPVVHITPTEIQGVTISKATGFNAQFIVDNKIGKGSVVNMVRSGDVIPYITESVSSLEHYPYLPHNCPSCESGLVIVGVDVVCKNPLCQAQSYKQVEHFLRTMGAENITQKTLIKLGLDTIESCYTITDFEIAKYEGFGMKRGRVIVNEIEKTLQTTPDRFIRALGIPFVGKTFSKLVYDHFRPECENDDHFMERAWNFLPSELMEIDGIGEVTAEYYFKNIRMVGESLFDFLRNKGLEWEQVARNLAGLTFCMTGKGPFGRKELQMMIEKKGGTVRSMSKSVSFLVVADPSTQTGKAKKARSYNIPIISYEDLMEMLK
jgi:DNA ligase (NAD+)